VLQSTIVRFRLKEEALRLWDFAGAKVFVESADAATQDVFNKANVLAAGILRTHYFYVKAGADYRLVFDEAAESNADEGRGPRPQSS
jgi:hypothetical protein